MSYVLDALRRAEADRQRGQVPDLHAPAGTAPPPARPLASPGRVHGLPALAAVVSSLALLAVMVMLGLWWWRGSEPAAPTVAPAARDPAAAPGPATLSAPVTQPAMQPAPQPAPQRVPQPVALPEPAPASRGRVDAAPRRSPDPLPSRPPLIFGGALDSPDPRARMVVINGQVWREGDAPAPGWVLERIGLHSARFRVQGRAVDVDYVTAGATR